MITIGNDKRTERLIEAWAAHRMADDAYLDALQSGRLIRETLAAHQLAMTDFNAAREQLSE